MNDQTIILPPTPESGGHEAHYKLTVMVPKRRYLSYLRERWWVVVVCLAVTVSCVVAYETIRQETYTSYAQLYLTLGPQLGMNVFAEAKDDFATQIELLKGSRLRRAAIERAGPRAAQLSGGINVEVFRPMNTSILQLRVTAPDAAVAQEFLKALIDEYLAFKKETRLTTAEDLVNSLTEQLEKREKELRAEQEKWLESQKTNNLPVIEEESKSHGLYLAEMNMQVARLRLEEELLSKGLDLEASGVSTLTNLPANSSTNKPASASSDSDMTNIVSAAATNSPAFASDAALKAARLQLAVVLAEKERLTEQFSEMHPAVRRLQDESERLRKTVTILEEQNAEQKRLDLDQVRKRIAAIEDAIPAWSKKVLESNIRLSEGQRLRNNLQRQQGRYDLLGSMLQTVDLNKNMPQERITVLDPPSPGSPTQRSLPFRVFLAVAGGLFLSLGIVFAWHLLDDRFVSVRDVKDQFGEMVLGLVPQIKVSRSKPQAALIESDDPRQAYVESYRHLRSALLLSPLGEARTQTLLFTGATPHEGKTTIAINLARVLARSGLRVALVDADLRGGGSLHGLLGAQEQPGVLDFLRGEAKVAAVVHETDLPLLTLVPIGSPGEHPEGLFLDARLGQLLEKLRAGRDFVIVDGASILSADDAALLAPHADTVVLVVRPFYTRSRLVRQALDMLHQRQAKQVAIIFNRARKDDLAGHYYARNGDPARTPGPQQHDEI